MSVALCAASIARGAGYGSDVAGYYPSWAVYQAFEPADVDWTRITLIEHAFADVGPDALLAATEQALDRVTAPGGG